MTSAEPTCIMKSCKNRVQRSLSKKISFHGQNGLEFS